MELLNARRETVDAECEQVARQTSDVRRNHAFHLVRTRTASELVGADSVNENPRSITQ